MLRGITGLLHVQVPEWWLPRGSCSKGKLVAA